MKVVIPRRAPCVLLQKCYLGGAKKQDLWMHMKQDDTCVGIIVSRMFCMVSMVSGG
jgi:hypothetical protein